MARKFCKVFNNDFFHFYVLHLSAWAKKFYGFKFAVSKGGFFWVSPMLHLPEAVQHQYIGPPSRKPVAAGMTGSWFFPVLQLVKGVNKRFLHQRRRPCQALSGFWRGFTRIRLRSSQLLCRVIRPVFQGVQNAGNGCLAQADGMGNFTRCDLAVCVNFPQRSTGL